jgi:hypothetical protein
MFNNLPTELILEILQKMKIDELIKTCNTDKKIYSICQNNLHLFSKIILSIPIEETSPAQFYNHVKNVNYQEILEFFIKNKLIKGNFIKSPRYISNKRSNNFPYPFTRDVLIFLIENGYDILSYNFLKLNMSKLTLPALKYLVEVKKLEVKKDLLSSAIPSSHYDIIEYLVEKGCIISFHDLQKLCITSFGTKKNKNNIKVFNYLIKKFNLDKDKVLKKIGENYNTKNLHCI